MCLLALVLLHFLWLYAHFAPASMSPDANGYLVQARLIAEEGRTAFEAKSPAQFVGTHWLETQSGVFHSRYPAGVAALFALAWKLGGLDAALLVNVVLASATLLAVYGLARRFVDGWLALLAAAVVAVAAVANQHALSADAHTAAAFFLVAGTWALLRFGDRPTIGRGLLAGVMLGLVPTMRYPEALAGVAIAAWLVWAVRPWKLLWPALAGAALPIGAQLIHNAAAYGAFWRTGYALTHEQTGFGWDYFSEHALSYLQGLLGTQGLGFFFAFGVAGLIALSVERGRRAEGLLFTGVVVPLVLLYMAYYFGGGASMRFLIPTFSFLAIAGVWLLSRLSLAGPSRIALVSALAGLQLLLGLTTSAETLARMKLSLNAAARARAMAERQLPAGSVLIAEHQLAESLDATGEWRLVEENLVGLPGARLPPRFGGGMGPGGMGPGGIAMGPGGMGPGGAMGGGGLRSPEGGDTPSPQQPGKNRLQQERYRGLDLAERRAKVWADIVQWAGDRPIYWYARSVEMVENALPPGADYESVAEIDAPMMMGPGGGGRGGPMMGGPGRGAGGMGPPMMAPGGGDFGPGPQRGGRGLGARGGRGPFGQADRPGEGPPAKLRLVRITFSKG